MNKKSKRTLAGLTAFLTAFSATAIPQVADNIGISVVANAADDTGDTGSGTTATEVSTIALTVTAPEAGKALATTATVAEDANYTVQSVTWKEGDTAVSGENPTAGYNKAYTAEITVALKTSTTEGTTYAWADSVTAKIGENDVSAENVKKDAESGNITITYTFAATDKQTISEVTLSGITAPAAGAKVADNKASTSETTYEVTGTEWYTGETKFEGDSFGYNTAYTVKITLKPSDDSKFDTNVTAKIGETTVDSSKITTDTASGNITITHTFDKTNAKTAPTADNFTFKAPTELTYDGNAKTAEVKAADGITGMGTVTVNYYDKDGKKVEGEPKDAGTYTVKISVIEGDSYKATTEELSDTKWTFTITQAKPEITVANTQNIAKGGTFTEPTVSNSVAGNFSYSYKASEDSTEITDKDEINAAIAKLDKDATGSISYTFAPTDTTNYKTVDGTISFSIVDLAFYVDTAEINGETSVSDIVTIKTDPTYGDTWSAIVTPSTNLKAKIGTDDVQGTFSVKDGDKMPAVGEQSFTIVFNSTDEKYTNVEVYMGTVNVAKKTLTISGDLYTVTKEYDGTKSSEGATSSGTLLLDGVVDGEDVSVKVDKIGDYTSADVTDSGKVTLTVSLEGENAGNYTLESTSVEVKGVITAKTINPSATISGTFKYTGEDQTPDVVVKNGTETLTKDTDYTVSYTNNKNVGKATATISPVSDKNYTFEPINAEFEIAKATLTAEGTGTANGTYGAKLSGLTVSGLTAKLGDKTVDGTWTITGAGSDVIPNVGETTATATFTPNDGADNYETLTAEVTVTITKAAYTGTIADTSVSFSKTSTDEKTVQLALPAIEGLKVEKTEKDDTNSFISDKVSCDDNGNVKFTLAGNATTTTGNATITVTFSSTNYENITAKLVISLTDKEDQNAPEKCEMSFAEDDKGTYTVTIKEVEGAEYSFDGTDFSDKNTKTGVAPNTTVTGYIRMKATDTANASPATSASITTPKSVSAAPTITKSATFTDSIDVTITCTDTNAVIYYTTDGKDPTTSSTKYSDPIKLTKTTTIKAIAVSTGKEPSAVVTATFTKKSSSTGGGGSSSGGGGRYTGGGSSSSSTTKNPTVDGKEMTWNDVAKDIEKLAEGKEKTISLNGVKEVPADVIKAIANSKSVVTIVVNDVYSWTIDGSKLDAKNAKALDLTVNSASVTGTNALRGIVGTRFALNGTNGKTELNVNFKSTHAGKFANLFKKVGDKLVFVDNVKLDKDGKAIGLEVSEKGDYVIMLGEYSDRTGDMDNDGILNAKDALAVLKDFAKLETGKNPLVADINGDGFRNALDALMILKMAAGIL